VIVIPLTSRPALLDALLDGLDTWYHLFMTALPSDTDLSLDDFTEIDWPDYTPQQVKYWAPALLDGEYAYSTADPVEWQATDDQENRKVWGYYVTNGRDGALLWWEMRCEAPIDMSVTGAVCVVWPRLTLPPDSVVPCMFVGGGNISWINVT
jgi:hypothetical protein